MTEKCKAIIVEDDPVWLRFFETTVSSNEICPFSFQDAGSIASAVTILESNKIDLILLDLLLPDSQGLDTVDIIVDKFPYIPVIVISTIEDHKVIERAYRKGVSDFLIKDQYDQNVFLHSAKNTLMRKLQEIDRNKELTAVYERLKTIGSKVDEAIVQMSVT